MKPNFALSLSFDGIRLLHRAAGGWHLVGDVPLDSPDLNAQLLGLRKAGAKVRTRPIRSKIILPDSQIKYLSLKTGALDSEARRDAARVALDGATPYEVDALVFDISPDGETTHVAAVARETLAEAEAFAVEHRFNPISFVANPEDDGFLGEPFFGETSHAREILPKDKEVEPDGVRVVVVPQDEEEPSEAPPSATEDKQSKPEDTDAEPSEKGDTAEDAAPQKAKSAEDEEPAKVSEPEPETPDAKPPPAPTSGPQEGGVTVLETVIEAVRKDGPEPVADLPPEADTQTQTLAKVPKAPPLPDFDDPAPEAETTTPPLLGFATRRRQTPSTTLTPLGGVTREPPERRPATSTPRTEEIATTSGTVPPIAPPKAATASLRPMAPPVESPKPAAEPAKASAGTGGFLSRRKRPDAAAPLNLTKPLSGKAARGSGATGAIAADPEAQRMTVFGARESGAPGKPRFLGLILTAILLIFLAGVAAWASIFMDEGLAKLFPGRERTLASTLPDDVTETLAEDVGATTLTPPDEEADDDVIVAALSDGLTSEDAAVLDALRDPMPNPVARDELDAEALEARYAVTGIWPKAPETPPMPADLIEIEDLYVTGIDPVSPALDAVAMPAAASFLTDTRLAVVTSPAAPGTNFALDPDGRIVPTPQGALSPDGFTVFLGTPPVVPPATRARLDVDTNVEPRPAALAQVRPRPRPADLIEQNERATLGGLSRAELSALRPRLRPNAPQDALVSAEDIEADAAEPVVLAAMTTLRPNVRPRNFDRIVARAERTAPAAAVRTAAAVAPRTVTPSIPSTASVTREATVKNAINLNRVNLIGVYGTPSNRRALVRLSNGRYKKVQVGDRFDGGRVSAIGDSELRYQKGSRNVVLKMPQG